jgi:hypothetical protein
MALTAPTSSRADAAIIATDIPARLDRLPWGRFHTLVVVALGITWILDGRRHQAQAHERALPLGAKQRARDLAQRGRAAHAQPDHRQRLVRESVTAGAELRLYLIEHGVRLIEAASGLLLAGSGYLFAIGVLSATGQTIAWMVIFFVASAAASSAYLTVSETFPLEIRALAIAFFYAVGTGIGGVAGPWMFGALIDTGSRWSVFGGYLLGAVLMLAAAVIAARYAVAAERKPLESVSRPLAAAD